VCPWEKSPAQSPDYAETRAGALGSLAGAVAMLFANEHPHPHSKIKTVEVGDSVPPARASG